MAIEVEYVPETEEVERDRALVLPYVGGKSRQMVDWWIMERFAADKFCVITSSLANLGVRFEKAGIAQTPTNQRETIAGSLDATVTNCRHIGLNVTALQVQASAKTLRQSAPLSGCSWDKCWLA